MSETRHVRCQGGLTAAEVVTEGTEEPAGRAGGGDRDRGPSKGRQGDTERGQLPRASCRNREQPAPGMAAGLCAGLCNGD